MGSIKVTNLSKAFGIAELFNDVNFEIKKGERVGFVGANGAGKSTLMKCLLGEMEYDKGSVQIDPIDTIGYVEQQADMHASTTLYEELKSAFEDILALAATKEAMEAAIGQEHDEAKLAAYAKVVERFEHLGGYDYESRLRRTAFGLGFTEEDFDKPVEKFSGGQRTRICLAKALIREPDFLFLDEPTNHLDIGMIEWLENFLQNYSGGVLIISHDRFFLDKVANRIFDMEGKAVTAYEGNYSYFMRVKEERRAAQLSAYEKQQEHIRKTEEYIRKYKAGIKSKQARGRQSQLNRLQRIVKPAETAAFNYFAFNRPEECAQRVAELEDVSYCFSDTNKEIFSKVSVLIRNGDGVAIVGPNGAGKTTLLRLLIGELEARSGRVKIGNRIKIGYFSQQHEGLHMERTLLEELNYEYGIAEEQSRRYLGAFLFYGDDVYRKIGDLSGGEQSRVAFLKLMLTGANFLVLDEPTNHLDIPAKEAVEEALSTFPGTYITVSHDRYFLDKVANCILELKEGTLTEYGGNYSYYREKVLEAEKEAAKVAEEAARIEAAREKKREDKEAKAKAAQEKTEAERRAKLGAIKSMSENKRQEMILRAEAEIAMAEAELKGLEFQMNNPEVQSDPVKSAAIAEEYAAKELEIMQRYEKWEQLTEA